MFKLKLHAVVDKNILKNIYTNIDCFNLYPMINIMYLFEFNEGFYDIDKDVYAHVFYLKDIDKLDREKLERIMISLENNVLVYSGKNEYLEYLGEKYKVLLISEEELSLNKDIQYKDINSDVLEIVKELLEYDSILRYKPSDFLITLDIYNNGKVIYDNEYLGNLKEELFVNVLFKVNIEKVTDRYYQEYMKYSEYLLSEKFPTRYSFMLKDYSIKDIIEFKIKVLNMLKDIKPQDYPELPIEFVDLLNKSGYIRMGDILNIIRR